jgi:predicted ATPase/transcriptional regulator with XRE-family HTH domain
MMPSPFGALLRTFRVRAGLSQEALAEASGVSVRTISDLERGQRPGAHLETIRLLAHALDLSSDQHRQLVETAHLDAGSPGQQPAVSVRPGAGSAAWSASLPTPITPFVGRTRELDELLTALRSRSGEIVTLTGTGGVGKTRLAIEAAHRLAPEFADGAAFVDLATVSQAELAPNAIAQTLGLTPGVTAIDARLAAWLANRELLLVLDNFEQIIEASPFIARLGAACPNLTLLVTSRVRLRVSSERELTVPPLSLADITDPLEKLQSSEANQLFAVRARRADPQFTLSHEHAGTVTEICSRLDGIPLAIELAASRLRILSLPELLDRLDRRLPMLTGGDRDLHPRQQSMQSTIAWSYALLTSTEQRFLRWMSAFAGGVSLESAEALGHALGSSAHESLEIVTTLLDNGLIRKAETSDGSHRFHLFETIREFGLEQLHHEGEMDAAQRFHAEHFLALARNGFRPPYEQFSIDWLNRIDRERPNVVQAFDFLCQPETAEQAMRFAAPMAYFWRIKGPFSEGEPRIVRAIELAPAEPSVDKAHSLWCASYLLGLSPDRFDTYGIARAGIEVAEQVGSPADKAAALQVLAFVEEHHEQLDRARVLFERALRVWESLDNRLMQAQCLSLLGGIEYATGDIVRAQASESRALELFLELDDLRHAAGSTWYQGMFAVAQGRMDVAAEKYDQSLRMWLQFDSERIWFKTFAGLADVAAAIGLFDSAARMIGATDEQLSTLGADLMPFDKPGYERARDACRLALDPERFDALVAAGRRLSPEEWLLEAGTIVEAARALPTAPGR